MPPQQNLNRRERHMLARRQDILDAALKLFEKKGYPDTLMEEISEAADVARATLYNHFESKADVLLALAGAISEQWLDKAKAKLDKHGSPATAIRDLVTITAEWFDVHPASASIFFYTMRELMGRQSYREPPPTLIPRDWIVQAREKGELTKELPIDMQVLLIESVLRHHLVELLRGTAKGKLGPAVRKQTDIVMARLR